VRKAPWKVIALIASVHLVLYAVLGDEGWIQRSIETELQAQTQFLGADLANREHERAAGWFDTLLVRPGIVASSFRSFIPTPEEKAKAKDGEQVSHFIFDWFEQRLRVFWTLVYQAMMRLAVALSWLPFGLLLIAPAAVDGWVRRRIKQTNFDYASPDRFGFSVLITQITVVGFFLLLFAPWSMPVVTAPICFILAAVATRVMLANIQKRI